MKKEYYKNIFKCIRFDINKIKSGKILSRGYTLVELLIYMGLLALFMGVLSSLFSTSVDLQLESGANTSVDRDVQYFFTRMAYDLHRAEIISTPSDLGVITDTLVFTLGGVSNTYGIDVNDNLTLTDNTGTEPLNSFDTKVTNISFTRIGNVGGLEDTIRINVTLASRYILNKGTESRNFQTTIALRR